MASSRRLPTSYNESTYAASGADYSVLATWEAATDTNLVTATDGEVLTCDAGNYEDDVIIGGATTSSSYFRVIRAADGDRGTKTSGARFYSSSTTASVKIISILAEAYFELHDLGLYYSSDTTNQRYIISANATTDTKVIGCTLWGGGSTNKITAIYSWYRVYCINNYISDLGSAGWGFYMLAIFKNYSMYVYNNTITDCFKAGYFDTNNGSIGVYLKNNITQDCTTNWTSGFGVTFNETTNITSGVTFEANGYLLDEDDEGARGAGTDLSEDGVFDFTDDIDYGLRDAWDAGCDEYGTADYEFPTGWILLDETINALKDRRVIAYDDDEEGEIELEGTYSFSTGTPTHIEVRVFNRTTTNTIQINSSDWNVIENESISGGDWSGSLSGIPKTNAWLGFEVRISDYVDFSDTGDNKIGVGYVVAYTGQSYIGYWVGYGPYTPADYETSNDLCSKFRHLTTGQSSTDTDSHGGYVPYTGWALNSGDGSVIFANKLQSELDCPIGVLDYGMGGSALLEEHKDEVAAGYWVGDTATDNWLDDLNDGVAVSEPMNRRKANAVLWYQGFSDCQGDVSYQDYYDGMTSLFSSFRTDLKFSTMPVFVVGQPRCAYFSGHDASYTDVRVAQIDVCIDDAETKNIVAGQAIDQPFHTDFVHLSEAGQESEGLRYAQSVLWYEIGTGSYTYHRGPKAVAYDIVDSTHTNIYLEHDGGTDFTPTSGIDSFEVYNGSSWISSTGARVNATTVQLTHASATVSDIRILYGMSPSVSNVLVDNTSLELPIEALNEFPVWESTYTKGDYASLPSDDTDLESFYSYQDWLDVATDDATRVAQTATEEYAIHEFKDDVGTDTSADLSWNGQTDLAPSSSTVYLQIYNQTTTTWTTVDSDNSTGADTDFTLSGNIEDLTDYKDGDNLISCRVYQLAPGL